MVVAAAAKARAVWAPDRAFFLSFCVLFEALVSSTKLTGMQVGVMAGVGKAFGLTILQSVRAGLLLAAGGEFAFVTFGEAVSHKILPQALVSKLFLIVSLSMALTPFLAEFGQRLGKMFEKSDFKVIIPS